jgi:hypothetical protein
MNQAEILFWKGNDFSDQGDIAQVKHKSVDYKALYEKAYLLKKEAACSCRRRINIQCIAPGS